MEFQGWDWPRGCVSLLLLGLSVPVMLAGGRLAVQGGAKFALEIENKREESSIS